ncbi:hypothetical protein O164_30820 [Pseudomonas taiwanensis SJ9]|uniref:Uncharacterized protein n=1 Tax=Pseudomonas taiwanensis SJ9 TaxID=1388762 RepID=V7D4U4_9PSED|nr:hypothetical protein O164_30820 [Pseudomonas taiwanensis SJ9]
MVGLLGPVRTLFSIIENPNIQVVIVRVLKIRSWMLILSKMDQMQEKFLQLIWMLSIGTIPESQLNTTSQSLNTGTNKAIILLALHGMIFTMM